MYINDMVFYCVDLLDCFSKLMSKMLQPEVDMPSITNGHAVADATRFGTAWQIASVTKATSSCLC